MIVYVIFRYFVVNITIKPLISTDDPNIINTLLCYYVVFLIVYVYFCVFFVCNIIIFSPTSIDQLIQSIKQ